MAENYVATSSITIDASRERVWEVLTDPASVKEFMFGTDVETEWSIGSPIVWRGVWKGRPYADTGVILDIEPGRRLVNTHFSPLSGQDDIPENRHTLTWTLDGEGGAVTLTLSQDNNSSAAAATHSKEMWDSLVANVKAIAERE